NPCALLLAAGQMLAHMGRIEEARRLRQAIVDTMKARDSLTPALGGSGTTASFARATAARAAGCSRFRNGLAEWRLRAPSALAAQGCPRNSSSAAFTVSGCS